MCRIYADLDNKTELDSSTTVQIQKNMHCECRRCDKKKKKTKKLAVIVNWHVVLHMHCLTGTVGCIPNPCKNGGICMSVGSTGYECVCEGTGFTGTECEEGRPNLV